MNRILRSQLPPNPSDEAVFDTTTGSSQGRTRWMRMKKTCIALLALGLMLTSTSSFAQSFATFGGASATTTTSTGSDPIDGYYSSFRYQVVYTAAELTTAGMVPNALITGLGFSISADYAGGNLNGYTIGLGHTTATNAATHNTAATTTVKNAFVYNPTVVALGSFDMITFDNSFVWNGVSNILVNICSSGPNAFTSPYGQVRMVSSTSGSSYVRSDNGDQCGVNTAFTNSNKPAIRFAYSAAVACSGTPNAGTASISASSGCAGIGVTLSASGLSTGLGLSSQWQSSSDNITWNNIPGATTATYAVTPSADTYYRIVTTCSNSGLSENSSSVSYQVNTCQASITMSDAYSDGWSGNVVTLNINGTPYQTFSLANGLASKTVSICVPQNSTYSLVLSNVGTWLSDIGLSFTVNSAVAYSAANGGMASLTAGSILNSGTACPPPCSGTPTAAATAFTGASSICFGQTKTMTATGISNSPGISVEWKVSSTSGGTYTAVNGGIGSTTASYTTPSSQGVGTYYYVLVTTCSNSGLTSTSDEIALTINALPTVVLTAPNGGAFCGTQQMTASGASTYVWTPVASLSSDTGSSVYFTGTANASVSVVGTSAAGCQSSIVQQPVTYTAPTGGIAISSSVPNFCGTGGTATISATSSAPYVFTFDALDGAVLSNSTATTVDAAISQTSAIRVTGTDAATGCSAQAIVSVGVYPLPDAVVTTSADGVCPGTSATINSGLSAGNFTSTSIPYAALLAPGTAVTLVTNGVATPAVTGSLDDGGWGNIPIGFDFDFFGTLAVPALYNTINVGTNGTLMFGALNTNGGFVTPYGLADYTFTTLPSAAEPFSMIAVLAMDHNLTGATGGTIKYWTTGYSPNRKFVVSYENIKEWGDSKFSTAQAIFYETTGVIEVHVFSSTNIDQNKLVGINNGNGTIGSLAFASGTVPNATNPISTPFAYRFSPPANFLTTWTATDANGSYVLNNGWPSAPTNPYYTPVTTLNGFSASVAPILTTQYSISYVNATTGCSNQLTPEQVTMAVLGTVAPQGVSATSTVTTVCPGVNIPLSTSYTGSIAGLTFQWQVSTDGGANWTPIAGATAATYTATQTAASSYRVGISSCGGTIEYTSPVAVALTAFTDCYCTPVSAGGAGTLINEVSVNATFTNNSSATNPVASPYYTNYSTLPGTPAVVPGVVMNLSLTLDAGTFLADIVSVWIDYNHSGTYEASEWTQFGTAVPSGATTTVGITIPTSALSGNTGMRIRTRGAGNANGSGDACTTTFGSGETEDYFINILGPCDPALFIAPLASADDIDATVCGTQTSQLTATDPNNSANPIYMWYDAQSGGTLLQNSTVGSYTPAAIAATTTWYVAINTGTCITDRSPVTLNWVAPPAITASNSNPEFCGVAGSSTDLSASSTNAGYTYSWSASPAAGSGLTAGTTGATVSGVTPTGSGVYTYTASAVDATGCSATASTTVNVYALPVAPTSVTGGSTCLNGPTLNVTGTVITPGTLTYSLGTNISSNGPAFTAGTATIALPAGATVTSASLVFTNVAAINGSWLSEIRPSLSGAATLDPTAISTLLGGTIATTTLAIPGASGITNGLVTFTLSESVDDGGAGVVDATFGNVSLVINYTVSSLPSWFNNSVASSGSFVGTGSPFNVAGTSILPSTAVSGSATAYAANVVTIGALTCYSPTVAAAVSVGQPLTVSVAASAPITQTFSLATNYSVAAGATQTLTGSVAIPAGAVVTSTVLRLNGVTSTDFTYGTDVEVSMSGASSLSNQVVANVFDELTNAGPYTYTASNVVAPGGDVFVTFVHNWGIGGDMDISSIDLLVTYSAPLTGNVCPGTPVTLNATTTGGGSNPVYQWNLNGSPIFGANSATYLATPLASDAFTVSVTDDCNTVAVTSAPYLQPFFTVTAGTITGPSAILVNDFTAPIPNAGTWTIAGQDAGSTIQWSAGATITGPFTAIPGATGTSQILTAGPVPGAAYLTATTTTTDGCSIQANVLTVVLGNANDTPCTAAPITMGNQGGQEWSTGAASAQTGETYGPGLTGPGNTIWFSFVAPASGHVSIVTTSSIGWDNYITLFSGSDCTNPGGLTQIGFNDDNGFFIAQAALTNVTCLVPDATYYIQMRYWNSFSNTVGQAGIILTDLGNIAPAITGVSGNITAPAITGTCAAPITWAAPVATDDQGCVTMTSNFNSGASFPVGVTTVTYTATDAQGLVTTASFTVTVNDAQLPTVTAPSNVTVNANISCDATSVDLGTPTTADNCTVSSVTNNALITYPLGVTTVTWTVTDGAGNIQTATQTVTVVDATNPTIAAPANVTVDANSSCNATGVVLGTPVTADNCSVASVTSNAPSTFPLGTTTVTWTVTDGSGNNSTATQTVTVVDVTNPTITAPANVAVDANSSCNATGVVLGTPVTADNCSVASVTNNAPSTFPLGTTTVTWTVTDGAGLSVTAVQTVTVVDATVPTITAPAPVTVTAALNACTATATLGSATTADNCGVADLTNNAPATFPIGNTTVTYTVTDVNGNIGTATQTVTVLVNPANIWYADNDGDTYGLSTSTVTACSQPVGYVLNATDCNDASAAVNPAAIEICGNAIDDNCSGLAEEGCTNPGENPSNATSVITSIWPNCNAVNGTLVNANVSVSAQTFCLTGEDKWHQFVATSEGISIVVNSSAANIVIELQTAAGVLVAQENAVAGLGGEILNHYGLTAGQVYKVGVRNYNSAQGNGTYSICVKMLKRGGCDYGPGPYSLCQYFKATWAGAAGTSYTFRYTGLTGPAAGNVYTRTQNTDICVLSSVLPTLPYGSTYSLLVTNTYTINNGAGVPETIAVPGLAPCSMSTISQPVTSLRTSDRCTVGPRFRGSVVASLPWVCGVTNWRWEFTELNAQGNPVGLPIPVNRGIASNFINLGTISELQFGKTYSVRTAPILSYTGTNYQWGTPFCLSIVGSAGMIADGSQANDQAVRMESASEVNMSLYPNPTHGTDVNINLSGVDSENVQIRIVDAMGRQVWSNRYSVNGVLNTNITFERPLANGLYFVEAIFNGEVQTQRMMVQK